MKKFLLLPILLLSLACSTDAETDNFGDLNIPEVFRGEFTGIHTLHWARVTQTQVEVETDGGLKTINTGKNQYFNGEDKYEVDLPNNEKLVLLYGNGYVGITVFNNEEEWIISDYFE